MNSSDRRSTAITHITITKEFGYRIFDALNWAQDTIKELATDHKNWNIDGTEDDAQLTILSNLIDTLKRII